MKKIIPTLLIIILITTAGAGMVSGENQTYSTLSDDEKNLLEKSGGDDVVSATESGNFNISFDDGYNGYCINYGDHEASSGDNFTVYNTSQAVNQKTQEPVGNELKTFFVDFYDIAMSDSVKTQHIIWHFTDNFTGWRVDPVLIEQIRNASSLKVIQDHGAVIQINNTTEIVFDFEVLKSFNPENQNFFAYKITLRDITENNENMTPPDSTNITHNSTNNQTNSTNTTQIPAGNSEIQTPERKTVSEDNQSKDSFLKSDLEKHKTGYNFIPLIIILLFAVIVLSKYRRD